jgi:hypothetical protein
MEESKSAFAASVKAAHAHRIVVEYTVRLFLVRPSLPASSDRHLLPDCRLPGRHHIQRTQADKVFSFGSDMLSDAVTVPPAPAGMLLEPLRTAVACTVRDHTRRA